MRERTAYQVDRVVVQNTSESTFWKTNRARRCKYHAPDPNPNTNRNLYPNYGDVYTSMQSTWYAVLSCITVITFLFVVIWFSSTPYTVPCRVLDDAVYITPPRSRDRCTQQYRHSHPQRLQEVHVCDSLHVLLYARLGLGCASIDIQYENGSWMHTIDRDYRAPHVYIALQRTTPVSPAHIAALLHSSLR